MVEFALVFLIFFSLIYAFVSLGIFLTLRFGLQNAAEDGARSALRYQVSLAKREEEAEKVATSRSNGWAPVQPVAVAKICQLEGADCGQACGPDWTQRCQVVVTVTLTGMRGILPPLVNLALPDQVVGRASMLLDGRAL
ncbi:TadE/TadG family type IV pilus assembly protein [Variovorax sp. PDC80]|uniref:TadE/TadG family type IV pilus assembly protein n=1 Tax=Variovorax sp. PDC80 TaxID=1882827 RepID=UPI00210B471D|nr:TadE/TadG family type IV pilus assembly protein [Variovorax sp. PDC80]